MTDIPVVKSDFKSCGVGIGIGVGVGVGRNIQISK
jgi:hypothetical protein